MNLHWLEATAGELITLAVLGLCWVWIRKRPYQPPADDERPPTTEYSSLNDD